MIRYEFSGVKYFGLCLAMASGMAFGQVGVETDPGSGKIFQGRNTGSQTMDGVAIYGESKPAPYYGIGVRGEGGYQGVRGVSDLTGGGNRYGGYFTAANGTSVNYGVYAYASGATTYAGYFAGNVTVTGTFSNPSDERLKKNIAPLDKPLAKVLALRPASYEFDGAPLKVKGLPKGRQLGLLAGDLESIIPELVQENPVVPDEDNKDTKTAPETYLSVNYIGLIPVLIGAIKEQQAQIEALKAAQKK